MSFSLAVIDGNGDYHYLDKKHTTFMREYAVDPTATSERARPLYYADFTIHFKTNEPLLPIHYYFLLLQLHL